MKTVTLIMGPPCASKTTQARLLSDKMGSPYLSTGELLREFASYMDPLCGQVNNTMRAGEFVPSNIVLDLMRPKIEGFGGLSGVGQFHHFILAGFPRNVEQNKGLTEFLDKQGYTIARVFELRLAKAVILDRMNRRAQVAGQQDDNYETLQTRLHKYTKETKPVLQEYGSRVIKIPAHYDAETIRDEMLHHIRSQEAP